MQHREHRERIVGALLRREPHDVAGEPAEERRDRVRPERRHHQQPLLARRDRLAARRIDDLEIEEIAPGHHAVDAVALDRRHRRLGHAEAVVDLRAPRALELAALRRGQRLRADEELPDRSRRKVDPLRLGDVREVQRVARHRREDRRLQLADELELDRRRRGRARAGPGGGEALHLRRARRELADRVDAERKGDVHDVAGARADARPDAAEADAEVVVEILGRARIEERLPGRAARAPQLARGADRRDAEVGVELAGGKLAQLVLGEDGDLRPLLGIVEPVEADAVDARREQLRPPRALDGEALPRAVDRVDLGLIAREPERPGRKPGAGLRRSGHLRQRGALRPRAPRRSGGGGGGSPGSARCRRSRRCAAPPGRGRC